MERFEKCMRTQGSNSCDTCPVAQTVRDAVRDAQPGDRIEEVLLRIAKVSCPEDLGPRGIYLGVNLSHRNGKPETDRN